MKNIKSACLRVLIVGAMLFGFPGCMNLLTVKAEENEAVTNAKEALTQVNLCYEKDGKTIVIQGGTGFFIGSGAKLEYIITAYHVLHMSAEDSRDVAKYLNITEDALRKGLVIRIPVLGSGNDGTEAKEQEGRNEKADYSVVKLATPISNRRALKLVSDTKESLKPLQNVYALGFQETIGFDDSNKYDYKQASITSGEVSKVGQRSSFTTIMHSAKISPGSSGGPLLNENGDVIGVNVSGNSESKDYLATDISEVIGGLSVYDITYEPVTGVIGQSVKPTEPISEEESSTERITQPTEPTSIEAITTKDEVKDQPESGIALWVWIVAVVVVLLIIVLVVIIVMANSKGKTADAGRTTSTYPPGKVTPPMNSRANSIQPQPPFQGGVPISRSTQGANETTVLNAGSGDTTVLSAAQQQKIVLTRESSQEKVVISKQVFRIGKERKKVDYCISDNNAISRVHAEIINKNGVFYLVDLNSTNGTMLNGMVITPKIEMELSNADQIKISDEEFSVSLY